MQRNTVYIYIDKKWNILDDFVVLKLYITLKRHQREEIVSLVRKFYDWIMQVRDLGQQNQGVRPIQKKRNPDPE